MRERVGRLCMLLYSALALTQVPSVTLEVAAAVLPPCATEDSDWCTWDAQRQGNGQGRSFVSINGKVFYL